MTDTIFGQIARGEMEADVVYEDDLAVAFRDLNPQAPVHVLVIPRESMVDLNDAPEVEAATLVICCRSAPPSRSRRGWRRTAIGWWRTPATTAGRR